ncbi:MAG TPA: ABC transporter substrate-binding protein [Hypericibacter adhaerens]|jgi:peptide/nickel transport system substrate-binding protein|uniref:ABC transporter substrate-binding protein n=1 Tax=Hypericibacter adhaerens TaxID=2602016 RepID=UPI002CC2D867|nr:ABC transporter substrate-binding protein [Hypericibacter adhaerens]HWA44624.1 ABC transporter substrate-binding protein [Hypericibacter adhaerens]
MASKICRRWLLIAAAGLATIGMGSGAMAAGKDLVIGVTTVSVGLDPMSTNSNVNERISNNLIETLLRIDPKTSEIKPGLAESWEKDGDSALVLHLRKGIKCHNGEDFNAEDVEYMFGPARYMGKDAPGNALAKQFLGPISAVKALDSYTVRVETSQPDPLLAIRLASWMSQVPCADAFKAAKSWEEWSHHVVGTGPYQLVEFKPGEMQKYKRFDGYWGDKAPADTLTFKVVPELAARVAGLFTGEYDIITEVTPDQIEAVNANKGTEVVGGAILNIRVLLFDTRNPVLKDPRVRQALAYAIDRQLIVDSLYGGRTKVPQGMQMDVFGDMFIPEHKALPYDPDKARALLKEAGYKGEEISYRYLQDYYTAEVSTAQVLASMWKEVGFNIKLELKENWGQIEDKESDAGRGIINSSNGAYFPDPIGQVYRLFGPNGDVQPPGWWKNDEFNKMGEILMTTDQAARRAAFAKMLDIFEQDPPGTYLHQLTMFYGKRKDLKWAPTYRAFMDFRAGALAF